MQGDEGENGGWLSNIAKEFLRVKQETEMEIKQVCILHTGGLFLVIDRISGPFDIRYHVIVTENLKYLKLRKIGKLFAAFKSFKMN